jgi:hypothetical protein
MNKVQKGIYKIAFNSVDLKKTDVLDMIFYSAVCLVITLRVCDCECVYLQNTCHLVNIVSSKPLLHILVYIHTSFDGL